MRIENDLHNRPPGLPAFDATRAAPDWSSLVMRQASKRGETNETEIHLHCDYQHQR